MASEDPQSVASFQELCGRSDRTKFRHQVIRPLLEAGYLEMTIRDKPKSPNQRYRTTPLGKKVLRARGRQE